MISRPMVGYRPRVGIRNYLIEGVSGTGKTAVCKELRQRGYHAINGDTELAYQGGPDTGEPTAGVPSRGSAKSGLGTLTCGFAVVRV